MSDDAPREFDDMKWSAIERCLGPMHDMVGHSVVPYSVGGYVHMYYFPRVIPGTAMVTLDMIDPDDTGPRCAAIGSYELIAFTRLSPDPSPAKRSWVDALLRRNGKRAIITMATAFNAMSQRFCVIFTHFARYASDNMVEPFDTWEVKTDDGSRVCLVLDSWRNEDREFRIGERHHGLMMLTEVLPQEIAFARSHGTRELIDRLKQAGHYPYSDLDRDPVV